MKARLLREAEHHEQIAREISAARPQANDLRNDPLQVRDLRRREMLDLSDHPRWWINKAAT